jgi:transcriptional/translational regulatory protein YebC/TACO1
VWRAKNPVTVAPEHREQVEKFLAVMDEDDDVQTLFVGMK